MSITPFHDAPKRKFLGRMFRPAIFVYFVGFVTMGILAVNPQVNLSPLEMARYEYGKLPRLLSSPPEVCKAGEAVSDFQKEHCDEYQMDIIVTGFWVAFPFLIALLFFVLALKALGRVYEESERRLSGGTGAFIGNLTDPPEMPNDLFGWGFCLRSLTVQLGKGKQLRVYMPLEAEIPKPGSELAIIEIGRWFSKTRYMAAPYTPHVAIIKG